MKKDSLTFSSGFRVPSCEEVDAFVAPLHLKLEFWFDFPIRRSKWEPAKH